MSHLSSVKTCLTELNILEYSLVALDIKWYRESWASISLPQKEGPDFGFVWNGDEYELMGDFSQWKQPWSIAVFIEKIKYQYVLKTIKMELQAKGFVNQETKNTNFEQITFNFNNWCYIFEKTFKSNKNFFKLKSHKNL